MNKPFDHETWDAAADALITSQLALESGADVLVLSTVNAPYKRRIDAGTLAACILSGDVKDWTIHVATLFVDVRPDLVVDFAARHAIDPATLARCYFAVRDRTGERSPALEAEFARLKVGSQNEELS